MEDNMVATTSAEVQAEIQVATDTPTPNGSVAVSARQDSQYSVAKPVANPGIPMPDFKATLSCTLSADICDRVHTQMVDIVATLTKNSSDYSAWISLGILHKTAGDYKAAARDWEYVSALYPKNTQSFGNLGDLYMHFIKDYTRAESNYLKEVKNSPTNLDAYRDLFTLYTQTSYQASASAAENILKAGIAANPDAIELRVILARYYQSQGRTADAKTQYTAAIASAESQGQTALAQDLQKEVHQLKGDAFINKGVAF